MGPCVAWQPAEDGRHQLAMGGTQAIYQKGGGRRLGAERILNCMRETGVRRVYAYTHYLHRCTVTALTRRRPHAATWTTDAGSAPALPKRIPQLELLRQYQSTRRMTAPFPSNEMQCGVELFWVPRAAAPCRCGRGDSLGIHTPPSWLLPGKRNSSDVQFILSLFIGRANTRLLCHELLKKNDGH